MNEINESDRQTPDVSIAMVSLNCWGVLKDCLDSLRLSDKSVTYELFLVDNGSTDGTLEKVPELYPEVTLVKNADNVGFLKGTNQGIRMSTGRYILWLNPDTILRPDSLRQMTEFLEAASEGGHCRTESAERGRLISAPVQARNADACRVAGVLHEDWTGLFPQDHTLGQYLLRYLPEDCSNEVDAVSGCCLMARRELVDDIGLLDEDLKQWGEDIEWCVRAKKAGWEVWYNPASVITHLKGQGGRHVVPYHVTKNMHYAMWIFYTKYFKAQSSPLTSAAVRVGIQGSLAGSLTRIWMQRNVQNRLSPAVRLGLLGVVAAGLVGVWIKRSSTK